VAHFDERTFLDQVNRQSKLIPWFVMFGGKQCPACVQTMPEFEAASEQTVGFAKFGYIDASAVPQMARELGVASIPAFFLFTDSGPQEFSGIRSATGFVQFISDVIGEGVEEADESWIEDHKRFVILFTRRFKPPAVFSAAFGAFRSGVITFGVVRDTETIEAFGNPPIPSIWLYKDGEKVIYKGKMQFIELIDRISEYYGVDPDDTNNL
jgi:thiol-disulfide isomerase/thioredoxin